MSKPRTPTPRSDKCLLESAKRLPAGDAPSQIGHLVVLALAEMHVSIVMVSVLAGVIERAGGSRHRFLSEARIEPRWIEDGTMRLSIDDYFRAIDTAIVVSGDPAFGLHMGEQARSAMFGVMGSLAEQAGTLRECVEMMDRYARLLSEGGFEPELHEHGETAAIRFAAMRGEQSAMRVIAEFVMTALSSTLQLFAGGKARPTQVRFAYPEPPYAAEYRRIFASAARFGQEFTEMVFPRAWLDKTHRYRSPELYTVLKEQADRSLVRLERDGSLCVQIERIMAKHGPLPLTMDNAARELGMSARSLQRRLRAARVNFAELVTRHRLDVAKRMLERPSASLQATAYEMGFASASAFHRAFKRWTGMTPRQYQDSF
jgi:AraC-like DNA-binding protein